MQSFNTATTVVHRWTRLLSNSIHFPSSQAYSKIHLNMINSFLGLPVSCKFPCHRLKPAYTAYMRILFSHRYCESGPSQPSRIYYHNSTRQHLWLRIPSCSKHVLNFTQMLSLCPNIFQNTLDFGMYVYIIYLYGRHARTREKLMNCMMQKLPLGYRAVR
jgi:hypothetical protein